MALPNVQGWLIDLRTAESIFSSGSNQRIAHCTGMCGASQLHICHCDEDGFRASPILKPPFITDHNCVLEPDENVFARCLAISDNPTAKRLLKGNDTALYLAAIAIEKSFGVISDHRSYKFATVYDLCMPYGVHIFSVDEFFAAL